MDDDSLTSKKEKHGGQISFPLDEWVNLVLYADRTFMSWQQVVRLLVREGLEERIGKVREQLLKRDEDGVNS